MFLIFATCQYAHAQDICPASMVCYSKPDNARISKDLTELASSRVVIGFFQQERTANASLVTAYQNALTAATDLTNALKTEVLTVQQFNDFQAKVIVAMEGLIDKLTAQLNKPTTAFQKFLHTAEKILVLAAGIAIGRAGL